MAEAPPPLARRVVADAVGSFFLFACVVGSGIMAQNLSGGNDALALLGNTLATGAILFVLITMLGPISGAHMNPAWPSSRHPVVSSAGVMPQPMSRRSSRSEFWVLGQPI